VRYRLWAYSYGLTEDRLRLYFQDFARIPVHLPDLPHQRRVVQILSTWDQAMKTLDRLIEVAHEEREVQLRELMSRLRNAHADTASSTLGKVAALVSGGTPSKEDSRFWNGSIPWITAKDMKVVRIADSELKITDAARAKVRIVPAGTVLLLTRGMTLMRRIPICVTAMESAFNQDVKALIPKPGVRSDFLLYALLAQERSILEMVDTAGHGTGRLDSEALRQIPLTIPSEEMQVAFAAAMSAVDRTIHVYSLLREQLRSERRELLRRLVREQATSAGTV
jgi:type I restriction enzyme S subunit